MSSVRPATPDDAAAIAAVLQVIVSERVHSAIDRAWTADEERAHLTSLSSREWFTWPSTAAGRLAGQVVIDGVEEDELLMEWFPEATSSTYNDVAV